jgi:hypothetical protein
MDRPSLARITDRDDDQAPEETLTKITLARKDHP